MFGETPPNEATMELTREDAVQQRLRMSKQLAKVRREKNRYLREMEAMRRALKEKDAEILREEHRRTRKKRNHANEAG